MKGIPISRKEAIELTEKYIKNRNLRKHVLALGACMKKLAQALGEDQDLWEVAGILHDLDYEETKNRPEKHAIITIEMLKSMGIEKKELLDAILAHASKKPIETPIETAIYSADPATGFIVACALMHPQKKLKPLDLSFLMRRFKEKRFAQGASRDQMREIERLGLSLEKFLTICLEAMQEIDQELGL